MKKAYIYRRFNKKSSIIIDYANEIIEEYQAQGFTLTLRQLYYQFVSRNLMPNTQKDYGTLGSIINAARLAGLVDWEAIVDMTRNLRELPHWTNPRSILKDCVNWYQTDHWEGQAQKVEVWIEKDALIGVIEDVCRKWDAPYFSCRGYTSQSEMWVAAQRLLRYKERGQEPVILHLGDHDPSGKDMSRDIEDRLSLFCYESIEVKRIALNLDQVKQYRLPPNPTKFKDSRSQDYVSSYGNECWELDALEPSVIVNLIESELLSFIDSVVWQGALDKEEEGRDKLKKLITKI